MPLARCLYCDGEQDCLYVAELNSVTNESPLLLSTPQSAVLKRKPGRITRTKGIGRFGRVVVRVQTPHATASLRNLPMNLGLRGRQFRVATRPSFLRIHRRKAVSEVSLPESGQSPLSADDPLPSFTPAPPAAAMQRLPPVGSAEPRASASHDRSSKKSIHSRHSRLKMPLSRKPMSSCPYYHYI